LTRIYFSGSLEAGSECVLPLQPSRHLAVVLRLREGDEITLFDGSGAEFPARIVRCDPRAVRVAVGAARIAERESPLAITLAQALCAGARMDYAIQKAVELGARAVQPLAAARSVVRLAGARAAKRLAHWQAVALAACEQCGRTRIPPVYPLLDVGAWLARRPLSGAALGVLLAPDATRRLSELSRPAGEVVLLAGPEGGFSAEERAAARAAGFEEARLGPRVLRTETAGVAALAALQALWGDF
jgi:16S rRNA (uracil1498-N3)-methyltransferase